MIRIRTRIHISIHIDIRITFNNIQSNIAKDGQYIGIIRRGTIKDTRGYFLGLFGTEAFTWDCGAFAPDTRESIIVYGAVAVVFIGDGQARGSG